jgi:hypothetical protein
MVPWIPFIVASTVVLAVAGLTGYAFFRDARSDKGFPRTTPSEEAREKAYSDRRTSIDNQPDDPATALFLLEEAKRHYTAIVDGGKAVETKATQVLTLAAGGSSALVLFGSPSRDGHLLNLSAPIIGALLLTLTAFIALLYVLRVKTRSDPSVGDFLSEPMAGDPRNRATIALSLAEDFEALCYEIAWARRRDPLAMFAAYSCLAGAALLVIANAMLATSNSHASLPKSPGYVQGTGHRTKVPHRADIMQTAPLPKPRKSGTR